MFIDRQLKNLLFVILLVCLPASAQKPLEFNRIQSKHGPFTSYATDILESRDGYIWIATVNGLARFDGYKFINYDSNPNDPNKLPASWLTAIVEDTQGRLWVGSDRGLSMLKSNQKDFVTYQHSKSDPGSIASNSISHIVTDFDGNLWVATNSGISRFEKDSKTFTNFVIPETYSVKDYNSLTPSTNNSLLIGTDKGLFEFHLSDNSFTAIKLLAGETQPKVWSAAFDSKGNLWLATDAHGAFYIDRSNGEMKNYTAESHGLPTDALFSIEIDNEDHVWFGTWAYGLVIINPEKESVSSYNAVLGDINSLPSDIITSIMQDKSERIWLATYNGVAAYDPSYALEHFAPQHQNPDSLTSEAVWSYTETPQAIWVGTSDGLSRIDKASHAVSGFLSSRTGSPISEIAPVWKLDTKDPDTLWLGTEYGIASFDTRSQTAYYFGHDDEAAYSDSESKILKQPVWSLQATEDGGVWIGDYRGNFYHFHPDKGITEDYSATIKKHPPLQNDIEILNFHQGDHGNFWLGTSAGAYYIDTESNQLREIMIDGKQGLYDKDWIYFIRDAGKNRLWISSEYNGLSLYQVDGKNRLQTILQLDRNHADVSDRAFYSLQMSNQDAAWFFGLRNIYHIDMDTLTISNYGSQNIPGNLNFHENSQFLDSLGYIYAGSSRGVYRFQPEKIKRSKFQPPVYISGIETNSLLLNQGHINQATNPQQAESNSDNDQKPVYLLEEIRFDYNDSVFSFEFTSVDFFHPENLLYSYKIKGLQDNWSQPSSDRRITLTNLKPGWYELSVKGTNRDMLWSDKQAKLRFYVTPKPWLTWWAYLAYGLVASVISFFMWHEWRARNRAQIELKASENSLSQALDGSGDELWIWDFEQDSVLRKNNLSSLARKNKSLSKYLQEITDTIHPDDKEDFRAKLFLILSGERASLEVVYRHQATKGDWIWLADKAKVMAWDADGLPLQIAGTCRDITSLKMAEDNNRVIASAFQGSSDGTLIIDKNFRVVSINQALTDIAGFDSRIIGKTFEYPEIRYNQGKKQQKIPISEIKESLAKNTSFYADVWFRNAFGKMMPVELRISSVFDSAKMLTHYVVTIIDISYRIQTQAELEQLANYDSLTGLPNRSFATAQIAHDLQLHKRIGQRLALLFLDLDRFKNINDSLGHSVGDQLLKSVAEKLKSCVRESDIVARLGGDEFVIALSNIQHVKAVTQVADKILNQLAVPITLDSHELVISTSIGIAIYKEDGADVETLLKNADTAMYHAKNLGRNNYQFFTDQMNQHVQKRIELEQKLRIAISTNALELHYQPKYSITSGCISGFEGLLRWFDGENGMISPAEFIPIAEESGLILAIQEQVVEQACRQLRSWHSEGFTEAVIAINISALQFKDSDFIHTLVDALKRHDLEPSSLELEITEGILIENIEYAQKTLNKLRALGFKLSLDDFGTGYSSLSYLKEFPIHKLKIDRSFVENMSHDSREALMVESIIDLAHKLGVTVVGEGIETHQQLALLQKFTAEEGQGFLMSKPLPAHAATALLKNSSDIAQEINIAKGKLSLVDNKLTSSETESA